ncbi:Sec-independent protein translocase subunit TatA/TatB [Thermophilibacter provencensis]|uniref:Sec-independent protein translocase protein TatA n=1 Tax=Thermophilibacter provencensis TaxID=1852386 RepID=A0ABT7V107_9ACTN|nr:twin-arginine translocase TatA/TatE family subunit [Thermophilibacter provencensis]MDM8270295.1 twin-arginine translocase TatA/TatE family subunit [Thermophilibacter provencensis]
MFGIGETELVLIVLFAFMIFGPDKLPGMGRTLGRALRQFKNAQEGFTEVVQTNIVDPAAEAMSDTPKRPNRKRHEEYDEDSDLELPEGEEAERPRRTETFAERKKRLAEEKAAREAAEKEAASAAEAAPADEDADRDDSASSADQNTPAGEAANDPQPTPAPSKPTVNDLYTMKRPSRPAASAGSAEVSLDASREASEAHSAERRAVEGDLGAAGAAAATTDEKEA